MQTIEMPGGFIENLLGHATGIITNFSPYITLVLGVLLAAVVIEIIIGSLRK